MGPPRRWANMQRLLCIAVALVSQVLAASSYSGSLVATFRDEQIIFLFTSDSLRDGRPTQLVFDEKPSNLSRLTYYAGCDGATPGVVYSLHVYTIHISIQVCLSLSATLY